MSKPNSFLVKQRVRLKWFLWVTAIFLPLFFVHTITSMFILDMPFNADAFLIAYFAYCTVFTSHNAWAYYKESIINEEKYNRTFDTVFTSWMESQGIPPFNHKKARRNVVFLSALSGSFNILMIVFHIIT